MNEDRLRMKEDLRVSGYSEIRPIFQSDRRRQSKYDILVINPKRKCS